MRFISDSVIPMILRNQGEAFVYVLNLWNFEWNFEGILKERRTQKNEPVDRYAVGLAFFVVWF